MLVDQVDFDAAFLNAPLTEEIYIKSLPGLVAPPEGFVYQLKKALYGLKQSPKEWWSLLRSSLQQYGWLQSLCDDCLFFRNTNLGREYF